MANTYTITDWLVNRATYDLEGSFYLTGTAADVQANLTGPTGLVSDTHIAKIIVTGPAEVTVSVAQLTSAASVLSLLKDSGGTVAAHIAVSDTGAALSTSFATVATNAQVDHIIVASGTLQLTASQLYNNVGAFARLYQADGTTQYAAVNVKDTATNLVNRLNTIQTVNGQIHDVIVSNNTQLTLTVSKFNDDAGVLGKVVFNNGTATNLFKISDSALNIGGTHLDDILANANFAKLTTITVSGGGAVEASIAQIHSDATVIAKFAVSTQLAVVDTSTNFHADVASGGTGYLATAVAGGSVYSVTFLDVSPAVSLTAADVIASATVLAKVATNYALSVTDATVADFATIETTPPTHATLSFAIADTTALVQADLTSGSSALVAHATDIASIALSGAAMTLSVAQIIAAADVLDEVTTDYTLNVNPATVANFTAIGGLTLSHATLVVTVVDSTAAIAADLALGAGSTLIDNVAAISAISINSGTTITLTAAQAIDAEGVLALIDATPYTLSVTAATIANVVTIAGGDYGSDTPSFAVLDTAANIEADLAGANTLGTNLALISAITLDGDTAIDLTAGQVITNHATLAKMGADYTLNVTTSTVAQVATLIGYSLAHADLQITVDDSALNIEANLVAGGSLVTNPTHIAAITFTDGGTPTIELTAAQALAAHDVAMMIAENYNLSILGASIAEVAIFEAAGLPHVSALTLTVVDTAVAIAADLALGAGSTLLDSGADVTAIAIDGSTTITLTAAQTIAAEAALDKIGTAYTLDVTAATIANVVTIAAGSYGSATMSIAVSDAVAAVQADLLTAGAHVLQANHADISGITLTGGTAITLSAAEVVAGSDALADITTGYTLNVTAASIANFATIEGYGLPHATLHVAISTDASTLQSDLTGVSVLEAHSADVASITLTDVGTPTITLTAAEAMLAYTVATAIVSDYHLSVTDASVAEVATIEAAGLTHADLSFTVSDSADAIATDLALGAGVSSLLVNGADITDIALNMGSTITLTAAQAIVAQAQLAKIDTTPFTLSVTEATVANVAAIFAGDYGNDIETFAVLDSAANFDADLSGGGVLVARNGLISAIVLNDLTVETISLTAAQVEAAAAVFAKMTTTSGLNLNVTDAAVNDVATIEGLTIHATVSFDVVDSAANVSANFHDLGLDTHVDTITIAPAAALTLLAATVAGNTATLDKMQGAYTITINDTELNVAANLDALEAATVRTGVTLAITLATTGLLAITEAQYLADTNALADIVAGAYTLNLSAVHAANVATFDLDAHVVSMDVLDSVAAVTANLAALEAAAGGINEIAFNDGVALTITGQEYADNLTVLNKITSTNDWHVTNVAADHAATIAAHDYVTNVDVVATATEIGDNIAGLETAATTLGVTLTITQTGAGAIELTYSELNNNPDALAAIQGDYDLTVTDVLAMDAAAVAGNTHVTSILVVDDGANISPLLDALNNNLAVTSITVQDNADLVLSAHDATQDARAISLLHTTGAISVSDTAAAISDYIFDLNAMAADLTSIIVSDDLPLQLNATEAGYSAALGKLVNGDTSAATIVVTDSAAEISSHLDALDANHLLTDIFINDGGSITLSVAQYNGDFFALSVIQTSNPSVTLIINDTADNIVNNAATIAQDDIITAVHIIGSTVLELSADAYAADGGLFAKLTAGSQSYTVVVSDNAHDVSAILDDLATDTHVTSIVVIGSDPLTLTADQITNDAAALAKVTYSPENPSGYSLAITDIAANIQDNFGALNSNTHVTQIIVSDSATAEVTLSAAAAVADTVAEGKLYESDGTTPAHVAVSDSHGEISDNFAAITSNAHIDHVTIVGGGSLGLTVDEVVGGAAGFAKIVGGYGITVTDNEAAITANLHDLTLNGHVSSVIVSDNAQITVAVSALADDAVILANLYNADGVTAVHVIVEDTADAIQAALGTLNGNTLVDKIVVSNSDVDTVTISIATYSASPVSLAELYQLDGTTQAQVIVSGDAADIAGIFGTLDADTQVMRVSVANSGAPDNAVVTLLAADAAAFTDAEGKLYQADGTTPALVNIDDTAGNVAAALDALHGNDHVGAIVVSDPATDMNLSATQLVTDADVLGKISAYGLAIEDTADNISAALVALTANTNVHTITVNDGHALTVTVAQLFDVGVGPTIATIVDTGGHLAPVTVTDTASAIGTALDDLQSMITDPANQIVSIVVEPNVAITVHGVADLTSDAAAIAKIAVGTPGYTLVVEDAAANLNGAALDLLATFAAGDHLAGVTITGNGAITIDVAHITSAAAVLALTENANATDYTLAVVDTAAAISGAIDALNSNTHITAITIGDGNPLTLTVAEYQTDTVALGLIVGEDVHIVDTAANIAAGFASLDAADITLVTISPAAPVVLTADLAAVGATVIGKLANAGGGAVVVNVSDTADHIGNVIDDLNTNAHFFGHITISDNLAVVVTGDQVLNDQAALDLLVNANGESFVINVSDSFGNLAAGGVLDAIQANVHIGTITVTGSDTFTVDVATYLSDYDALAAMQNSSGGTEHIAISDTGADLQNMLTVLSNDDQVTAIHQSDSAQIILNVAQFVYGQDALAMLAADGSGDVVVRAQAGSFMNYWDQLNALAGANGPVDSIEFSNNRAAPITASDFATDRDAIGVAINRDGSAAHFNIYDTGTNIAAYIADLHNHVSQLSIVNNTGGTINLTSVQYAADADVLAKLSGTNNVHVSGYTTGGYTSIDAVFTSGLVTSENFYNGATLFQHYSYTHDVSAFGLTGLTEITQTRPTLTYTTDYYKIGSTFELNVNHYVDGSETYYARANGLHFDAAANNETFVVNGFYGASVNDTFHFAADFGADTIKGYSGSQTFEFSTSSFTDWTDLVSHATVVGSNVVLTDHTGDTLTFVNTTLTTLTDHSSDFHFYI